MTAPLAADDPRHGRYWTYARLKCRCAACRAANAEKGRRERARIRARLQAGGDVEKHGAFAATVGCRCDVCVEARLANSRRENDKRKIVNDDLRERATRSRQQWTGAEIEIATARDGAGRYLRGDREVAAVLGRSFRAVQAMRHKCLADPRYARMSA